MKTLSGPVDIIVPFTEDEISSLWAENKNQKRACGNFWLKTVIPKERDLNS